MSVRGAARPILEKNFMSNAAPDTQLGKIVFVGAGPGNPDLLTVRAREVLANSAIAVTDPEVMQGVRDAVAAALPVPQELLDAAEAEYAPLCADAKAKGARRRPPRRSLPRWSPCRVVSPRGGRWISSVSTAPRSAPR